METKFGLLEKVFYLNTAECKILPAQVKGIRIIPTEVSKDESGADRLDGSVVLYETFDGPVLAERECFASEDECKAFFRDFFA